MTDTLVYGSYGYTGSLVVEEALQRGLDPVIAGRSARDVERQAREHGLDHRVFSLATPRVVGDALEDADVVLNCAGPFEDTAGPLVDACLETGTDYLDITGEMGVFETLAARDDEARTAGITLLPGVGFDVVPTDCVAATLANRLPRATDLRLAFRVRGGVSAGTARTVVRSLGQGGAVRRDGRIQGVPFAHDTRRVDFGDGPEATVAIPWGDVSTAYHTTGIPDVTVYSAVHSLAVRPLQWSSRFDRVLASRPVRAALNGLVDRFVEGPDERDRETGEARVWGQASNETETVVARLRTPDTYQFTARSAVKFLDAAADGAVAPGFQTPAGALGADAVTDVEGVEWAG